jgi:hypothetical protein
MQMQIKSKVVTKATGSTATTLGHEAHSMPPIDSAQKRRDCMYETRLNNTYGLSAA